MYGCLYKLANPKQLDGVLKHFNTSADVRKLLAERYRPPKVEIDYLAQLPPNTLGYQLYALIKENKLELDYYKDRIKLLRDLDDLEFFEKRIIETHDIWHVLTGYPITEAGEAGLQAFNLQQMTASFSMLVIPAALMRILLFVPKNMTILMDSICEGWINGRLAKPMYAVHWEELLHRDIDELRSEYCIVPSKIRA